MPPRTTNKRNEKKIEMEEMRRRIEELETRLIGNARDTRNVGEEDEE
jgi:hypothetical protein